MPLIWDCWRLSTAIAIPVTKWVQKVNPFSGGRRRYKYSGKRWCATSGHEGMGVEMKQTGLEGEGNVGTDDHWWESWICGLFELLSDKAAGVVV